ncbi:MAG: class I SAM-dependent methyltransferase [Thermomicrobiales bacterium]
MTEVLPKPDHLGPEYGAQFQDPSVVAAYHHRPPYPDAVYDILVGLIAAEPRTVLDVGTGTGAIARGLAGQVARVDALDLSRRMLAKGRGLPGGDHPNLVWIEGYADSASSAAKRPTRSSSASRSLATSNPSTPATASPATA